MSKPTRGALVCAFLLAACATGGQSDGDPDAQTGPQDAAVSPRDANTSVTVDAPVINLDAGLPMLDAYVPPPADAATGPFCQTNSQCTVPGECCVTLGGPNGFCGPGTVVLGQCFPQ